MDGLSSTPDSEPRGDAEGRGARKAAVTFIFVTVLLDMIALGVMIPVLPNLVKQFEGGDTVRAAQVIGVFGMIFAAMQFFFSPIMGSLSDRYGRRPIILLSNVGLGLDYILMALAPNMHWLFAGRVIAGITAASVTCAGAYIADVTPPEKRAAAYGLFGAAFGIGFVIGPAAGGLLGGIDPRLPFWVSAGLSLANAIYGMFVLPESLPLSARSPFSWAKSNPLTSFGLLRRTSQLLRLGIVTLVADLAHVVLPSVFVLYAGYRYGWNERQVGLTLAWVGVCSIITQGVLVKPIIEKLGERGGLVTGLVFGMLGFVWFGLATQGWMFLVGVPLMSLWGVAGPATQALMSADVGPDEQGRLAGVNTALMGLAELIGPLVFTGTFAYFISTSAPIVLPGAPFLLSALLLALAAALVVLLVKKTQRLDTREAAGQ